MGISFKGLKNSDKVEFVCEKCGVISYRTVGSIRNSWWRNKDNRTICAVCARREGAEKRPQNSAEFTEKMRNSDAFRESNKNKPRLFGSANPMYGKKHTTETKRKMSLSRTGKLGPNATAWRGGKETINKRLKRMLQRRTCWFSRIFERDHCTCQHCGTTKLPLDAHHIVPLKRLIDDVTNRSALVFETEEQLLEWLFEQPEIVDTELQNGVTLCRKCHKRVHKNWGSHYPQTEET